MSDTTRLGFVKRSAAAAAGMTVVGGVVAEQADAKAARRSGPVVAYIHKPASGEIVVMHGKRQVKLRDRKLAAQLARAAG
jgi:hypothetical protein